jgi:FixJ family two-component response regulator
MISRTDVVVIDDDLRVCESVQSLFEAANLRAHFFRSAEDFLREQDLNQIGCLVCDVRMPGLSGFDLYRRIARTHPHIPTIFITAHAQDYSAADILAADTVTLMEKPFDGEVLLEKVMRTVGLSLYGQDAQDVS